MLPDGRGRDNEVLGWDGPNFRPPTAGSALRLADEMRVAKPDGDVILGNIGITREANNHGQAATEFDEVAASPVGHASPPKDRAD